MSEIFHLSVNVLEEANIQIIKFTLFSSSESMYGK